MALLYINIKVDQLMNIFTWLYHMKITKWNYKQISFCGYIIWKLQSEIINECLFVALSYINTKVEQLTNIFSYCSIIYKY